RWGNLPPELRVIKDRWLGASSDDLGPLVGADIPVPGEAKVAA
ncbi:unnamed protein product, partial [Sphacelaria rigidula]